MQFTGLGINPGGVLLSHTVPRAVPLALEGLTSEFGMGSGMTPPTLPPKRFESALHRAPAGHVLEFYVSECFCVVMQIGQTLLPTLISNLYDVCLRVRKSRTAD